MKDIIKFLLALGLLLALSSCGTSKNGVVTGKKIVCRNGVCSMYK
jgi:hypothetical protein